MPRLTSARLLSLPALLLALAGCETSPGAPFGAVGPFGVGKADGSAREIEAETPVTGAITSADHAEFFVFAASAGTVIDVEVTQAGSSRGLDTFLRVLGPMGPQGTYDEEVASDDESGYGQLSRIEGLELAEGDYVIELTVDPSGATDLSRPNDYRLVLEAEGGMVDPPLTGDLPKEVHYVRNSAEYVGVVSQAYRAATLQIEYLAQNEELGEEWAVIMDVDETILSNSQYRRERGLGVGTTWWQWVGREEATALPGADAFMDRVRALGGHVALVTNRHASQCRNTENNLAAQGIEYDVILCQDGERDKEGRWQQVERGEASAELAPQQVVMWVGDNIHDFRGMGQEHREDPSAFGDFGTRFIIVPNPMSGSWVSNPQE